MYEAGLEEPGTMAAIIGLDEAGVRAVVDEASKSGVVVIANFNSPAQYAVSGEVVAVERAIVLAKENGAKRAMRLQVSGAFHSPLLANTESRWRVIRFIVPLGLRTARCRCSTCRNCPEKSSASRRSSW